MSWRKLEQFSDENPFEFVMAMMELDVALAGLSTSLGIIIRLQHAGIIPVI